MKVHVGEHQRTLDLVLCFGQIEKILKVHCLKLVTCGLTCGYGQWLQTVIYGHSRRLSSLGFSSKYSRNFPLQTSSLPGNSLRKCSNLSSQPSLNVMETGTCMVW